MTCCFCSIASGQQQASLIHRDELCSAFMDLYPISPGHLLIVPNRHVERFDQLLPAELGHITALTQQLASAVLITQLRAKRRPEGYNILNNNGRVAQQHVAHLHIHVIPRYKRDLLKVSGHLLLHAPGLFIVKARRKRLDQQALDLRTTLSQR